MVVDSVYNGSVTYSSLRNDLDVSNSGSSGWIGANPTSLHEEGNET